MKPLLGRKLAASLTHDDVVRFQRDVAAGKSKTKKRGRAIVDGGPGTAARRWRCSERCWNGRPIPTES